MLDHPFALVAIAGCLAALAIGITVVGLRARSDHSALPGNLRSDYRPDIHDALRRAALADDYDPRLERRVLANIRAKQERGDL